MSYIPALQASWQDAGTVCALSTEERHLGHVMRKGRLWHAYDGTHADETSQDFRCIGVFSDLTTAKQMVELAVWRSCAAQSRAHSC